MDKKKFNQIRDEILDGYDFVTASEILKLTKKLATNKEERRNYACPLDIEAKDLEQDVKELLNHLYECEEFRKEDCSVQSGRFRVTYTHEDGTHEEGDTYESYEINIDLLPLSGSFGKASDGGCGYDFD